MRCHRRIRQGSQQIEDRTDTDIATRLHRIFHSFMKQRRKQKADAEFINAGFYAFLWRIHLDTQSTQDVGASRLARYRSVPMLSNTDPGPGHNESTGGRDIKGPFLVPPRTTSIQNDFGLHFDPMSFLTHHTSSSSNFLYRLPLHSEGGQKGSDLQRRCLPGHDLVDYGDRFDFGEIGPVNQLLDRFPNIHFSPAIY